MPVHAPTQGGDYWLFTAIGLYPEARPEKVKQETHQIGFGVGATVPLWKEFSVNLMLNAGEQNYNVCPGLTFYIPTGNYKMPVIFNARYQLAKEYDWFDGEGMGVAVQAGTYLYSNDKSSMFLMTGFGWGTANDWDEDPNVRQNVHVDGNGWCILNNIGYSLILSPKASFNLETSIIYQYSNYDQIGRWAFSPNVGIMFKF